MRLVTFARTHHLEVEHIVTMSVLPPGGPTQQAETVAYGKSDGPVIVRIGQGELSLPFDDVVLDLCPKW